MNHRVPHQRHPRQGAVALIVLACLLVATTIGLNLARLAVVRARLANVLEHRAQALWLVESGRERAAYRWRQSDTYQGETWQVTAAEWGGTDAGRVEIQLAEVNGDPESRRVVIIATFPADSPRAVSLSDEFVVRRADGGSEGD